ncbi:MAG: SDR family NAD(P)-dependent oxidoreductase [Pseudomonadales bacterium]|nr:SDR family NAD(P)-dependent oxidoreductase [Pseudomonadales bacterium]
MKDVQGKTAFITGGASGMGLGMARAFLDAGMQVMIADIDAENLKKAEVELQQGGAKVSSVVCDVTKEQSVFDAADKTVEEFGKVHVLCNNAGVGAGGFFDELSQSDWDWVTAVNQMGVLYGIRAFLPKIKSHGEGGHVVTTSSMAGLVNSGAGWGPYNSTKYAVVAMSEVLYSELKGINIGCSVLCPGAVATNIGKAGRHRPSEYGKSERKLIVSGDGSAVNPLLAKGLNPNIVGKLVLEGIQQDEFYIFTDPRLQSSVDRRFERIKRGFEWSARSRALVDTNSPGSIKDGA